LWKSTKKRSATDQSGGNGDQKGGTESLPDASLRDSVRKQRMKTHPAEEEGVLRKTQTSSRLQKEPHSLNWARARAIFPGPDTEKGKLDLKGPHKKRAERREANEAKLQPEVDGATSRAPPPENLTEGRSFTDTPLIGNKIHKSLAKETDEASGSPRSQRRAR
jgi:hypothetical protein